MIKAFSRKAYYWSSTLCHCRLLKLLHPFWRVGSGSSRNSSNRLDQRIGQPHWRHILGCFLARLEISDPADVRIDGIAVRSELQQRTDDPQLVQGLRNLLRSSARIFRQLVDTRRNRARVALDMRHGQPPDPQRPPRAWAVDDDVQHKPLLVRINHDGIAGHGCASRSSLNYSAAAGPAITSAKPPIRALRPALWRCTSQ